jgi:sec-independent protein translocase protein TatA
MGDIGVPELLIVLAIVVILFGPARLAGIGKSLGQAIRSFRNEVRDETQQTTEQGEKHG